jgi:hypothetical protein
MQNWGRYFNSIEDAEEFQSRLAIFDGIHGGTWVGIIVRGNTDPEIYTIGSGWSLRGNVINFLKKRCWLMPADRMREIGMRFLAIQKGSDLYNKILHNCLKALPQEELNGETKD